MLVTPPVRSNLLLVVKSLVCALTAGAMTLAAKIAAKAMTFVIFVRL